jgi:hypothetical protein
LEQQVLQAQLALLVQLVPAQQAQQVSEVINTVQHL